MARRVGQAPVIHARTRADEILNSRVAGSPRKTHGRLQVFADHDPVIDLQAGGRGELSAWLNADSDDHEVAVERSPVARADPLDAGRSLQGGDAGAHEHPHAMVAVDVTVDGTDFGTRSSGTPTGSMTVTSRPRWRAEAATSAPIHPAPAAALQGVADGGIIVGVQYARSAGLEVGDTVTLRGPRGSRRAPVAGVLDGIADFGGNEMQLSLATMRDVYGITGDAQLAVRARSDAAARPLERKVESLMARDYPGLEIASLADKKQEVRDQVSATFNMFNSIVAIAVIVSLLGVVNTLAMSVLERTREIGVLRALGSSRWQVRRTMLDESLLICAAGAICGVAIGAAWIPGFARIMPGLTFHFPAGTALAVAAAAVGLGTLAAILPARRAARLKVIEALTYE